MSSIEEAVQSFAEAAIEKGAEGGPRDHELYEKLKSAYRSLEEAGDPGLAAFRSLAEHQSSDVRRWAAATLLARGESEYQFVLESLAREDGLGGFSAEMTLREWRAGRLGSVL